MKSKSKSIEHAKHMRRISRKIMENQSDGKTRQHSQKMHSFLRPFLFFSSFFPFFVVVTFFPLAWKKLVKHAKQINKDMQKRPRQKMNNRKKKTTFFANFGFHSSFSILVFLLAVFFRIYVACSMLFDLVFIFSVLVLLYFQIERTLFVFFF